MYIKTMKDLQRAVDSSIETNRPLGIFIEMPGFPKPELIINPVENLKKKLEYWIKTYDENLMHKHAKGIRIVGYTFK